jgi:hypothetical protein
MGKILINEAAHLSNSPSHFSQKSSIINLALIGRTPLLDTEPPNRPVTMLTVLPLLKYALKRLHNWVYRFLNFISFGWIRLPAGSYLSDYYIDIPPTSTLATLANVVASGFNSSSGCLSSNSSESEGELFGVSSLPSTAARARRRSPRTSLTDSVAIEAVAHSYEDITRPDYHNYLWLSSRWDRTDLGGASYFVANWIEIMQSRIAKENISTSTSTSSKDTTDDIKDCITPAGGALSTTTTTTTTTTTKHCKSFLNFLHKFASLPDSFFPRRRIVLPKRQKTLVLDLDETLIHSTAASCVGFDFMIEVLIGRTSCLYYVYKRPHLDYFLEVVKRRRERERERERKGNVFYNFYVLDSYFTSAYTLFT